MEEQAVTGGTPPRRGRRLAWALGILGVLGLLLGGAALFVALLPRLNRLGQLQWHDGDAWRPFPESDQARERWPEGAAFLTPTWVRAGEGLRAAELRLRRWPNPVIIP